MTKRNAAQVPSERVISGGEVHCDMLTCIAGSMAEAFYGFPEEMKKECRRRLSEDMLQVLDRFEKRISARTYK